MQYVFYLHGAIIEDAGRRPTHPRWGVYEYDAVLDALQRPGRVLISEQRKPGTRIGVYAKGVARQVEGLLEGGVPADRIAVIGFSKGGRIARALSAQLDAPIHYVLVAACFRRGQGGAPLHGRVLSLHEASDSAAGSCRSLFRRSKDLLEKREVRVEIGGGHGAFYRPDPAWLLPLEKWLASASVNKPESSASGGIPGELEGSR
jgi:dienelactone hydrolase